jgi:hypothetical protein
MADEPQQRDSSSREPEAGVTILTTDDLGSPTNHALTHARDLVAEQLMLLRNDLVSWRSSERDEGPSLQDLREDLQGTLREEMAKTRVEAEAIATRVEDRYREIDGRVKALLDGRASEIDDHLRGAAEALRKDIEAVVREAKQEHDAIEQKRARTEAVFAALVEVSDQQVEHITQYQPGTIQQLRQRLAVLEQERDDLRSQKVRAEEQAILAQRELQSYKTQHGLGDIGELENQKAALKQTLEHLRAEIGSVEQLKVNLQEMTREVNELRALRDRYETVQRGNVDAAQLSAQVAKLEKDATDLDWERRDALDRVTKAVRKSDMLQRDKERLARELTQRDGDIKRLEELLESHTDRERSYEERCGQVASERQRLKDREQHIEQSLTERGRELHEKEQRLEDAYVRRHADLRDNVALEHHGALDDAVRQRQEAEHLLEEATRALDALKQEHAALQRKDIDSGAGIRDRELQITKLEGDIARHRIEMGDLASRLKHLRDEEGEALAAVRAVEAEVAGRKGTLKALESEAAEIRGQIERLRVDRERKEKGSTREARIVAIEQSVPGLCDIDAVGTATAEADWLDGIRQGIVDSGFRFPDRLLKAFHTSLKIADWSSLTVLAGVSGTGKSELPKLYARFGGMAFMPVPVLPNWDSPSDLFGFFDYLSGQFKPTQLLQSLARCTRKDDERMLVVMLDEMNLARVELYFSELLSRLEGRRHDGETPRMPVDIGSGMEPYEVPLGSNLLFVGTVNEDESTNTLSDKVLDRANVIYFPRPRQLVTRDQNALAPRAKHRVAPVMWKTWQRGNDCLEQSVRSHLKTAFERINEALSLVNRAVAHRILQITERYVANHPDMASAASGDAWKSAFEDQLAQKVMPKLRGVTVESGDGRRCLDLISKVLDDYTHTPELREDFKRACGAGDGQFVWCSSSYLEDKNSEA